MRIIASWIEEAFGEDGVDGGGNGGWEKEEAAEAEEMAGLGFEDSVGLREHEA